MYNTYKTRNNQMEHTNNNNNNITINKQETNNKQATNNPGKDVLLDFETKSLRDTRDILSKVPNLRDSGVSNTCPSLVILLVVLVLLYSPGEPLV